MHKYFIEKAKKKHLNYYTYDKVIYKNSRTKVTITCPVHGDFQQTPSNHLYGLGCPICSKIKTAKKRTYTTEYFIKKAISVHGNEYDYDKVKYNKAIKPVDIICKKHGVFKISPHNHLRGYGCKLCSYDKISQNATKTQENFILQVTQKHGNKYDYSKSIYKSAHEKILVRCKKHGDFEITPNNLLRGHGCPKCAKENNIRRYTLNRFLKLSKEIHGDKYKYDKVLFKTLEDKVIITCPLHGDFYKTPKKHIHYTSGCPRCKDSKGEIKIENFLRRQNIRFEREYVLPKSRFRYDFYLPELNILIEYDGIQHYEQRNFFGGKKEFDKTLIRDKTKNELAREHGKILIRVSYKKYNDLDNYLLYCISRFFKYRKGNLFFKTFLEIANFLHLPNTTVSEDVKKYLVYKN